MAVVAKVSGRQIGSFMLMAPMGQWSKWTGRESTGKFFKASFLDWVEYISVSHL